MIYSVWVIFFLLWSGAMSVKRVMIIIFIAGYRNKSIFIYFLIFKVSIKNCSTTMRTNKRNTRLYILRQCYFSCFHGSSTSTASLPPILLSLLPTLPPPIPLLSSLDTLITYRWPCKWVAVPPPAASLAAFSGYTRYPILSMSARRDSRTAIFSSSQNMSMWEMSWRASCRLDDQAQK